MPPAPGVPMDTLSAVLESFVARLEAACGRKGGQKAPPPSSGECSDSDSGLAAAQDPGSGMSENADQDLPGEEDPLSGSLQDRALVRCYTY